MAPFGALLSTLAASLLFAEPSSISATSIPALDQISTTYESTQSAAGFMVEIRAKNNPVVVYGLDVNVFPLNADSGGPDMRVLVYTKQGKLQGHTNDESSWDLWMNTTIVSYGLNEATPIPQRTEDTNPILVNEREIQAFYVAFEGPYVRYSDNLNRWYYQNQDVVLYGRGTAKRLGWSGANLSPRTFNGAVHYYQSDQVLDLPVQLLPASIITEEPTGNPIESPTASPEISPSQAPSSSGQPSLMPTDSPTKLPTSSPTNKPTGSPTLKPTNKPTKKPTPAPTASPVSVEMVRTKMEDETTKPVLVYAGTMFDLKGRGDIEISLIGFNTYLKAPLDMQLYIRDGGYEGAENDITQWTSRANLTVTGQGMGNPTYLPKGSFEPFLLRKGETIGIYLTTNGPYLRASKGELVGKPHAANPDMVLFEGVGKRYPIDTGTIPARIFNGAIGYNPVVIPTPSPTIDTDDLFVRNMTFAPVLDTFIQKGKDDPFGKKAQLMVDGAPKRVSLIKFDISVLNGNTVNEPDQILSATLRMYSMTGADFGGYVNIIPDGDIDEDLSTWDNVPYGEDETGTPVGQFRSIWPNRFHEMDITEAFRGGGAGGSSSIPKTFLVRISSDQNNGVMFRARDGGSENGPRLIVKFAYQPDDNKALAKMFGSDPPTQAPTIKVEWEDATEPQNPSRTYFNYNPRSRAGPNQWNQITPDGYYAKLKRLKTNVWRNRCSDGRRQSPRDLCQTSDKCEEFHETRPRVGQYGLGARNETKARPTPFIMHNKLRLEYKARRSEREEPIPPGADFARNGFNSGIQDLVNIDIKVRSEHRLCGKQYDAEMQQYYLHTYGNLEAISILIEADGEHNDHFQIMLDFFEQKFNVDKRLCQKRQRRARALLDRRNENDEDVSDESFNLRGGSLSSSTSARNMYDVEQEEEDKAADNDESSSLSSFLYHKIHDRFLSLIRHRELREQRWDPLQPWDILKSVHFWGYSGSTTEPPCFEDVKWRVVDVPMKISPKQYLQLKRLMFDHVDPDTCRKTSTHFDESNARPVQPYRGGATYRCRRSNYASDMERAAAGGRRKGFVLKEKWRGVDMHPYVTPEFPTV